VLRHLHDASRRSAVGFPAEAPLKTHTRIVVTKLVGEFPRLQPNWFAWRRACVAYEIHV
jgi:hypothetical protein